MEFKTVTKLFSPLGKLADRAIYFACVNFFLSFKCIQITDYQRVYMPNTTAEF